MLFLRKRQPVTNLAAPQNVLGHSQKRVEQLRVPLCHLGSVADLLLGPLTGDRAAIRRWEVGEGSELREGVRLEVGLRGLHCHDEVVAEVVKDLKRNGCVCLKAKKCTNFTE